MKLYCCSAMVILASAVMANSQNFPITAFEEVSDYRYELTWSNTVDKAVYQVQLANDLQGDWVTGNQLENVWAVTPWIRGRITTWIGDRCFLRVRRLEGVTFDDYSITGALHYSTNLLPDYPIWLENDSGDNLFYTITDDSGRYQFPAACTTGAYRITSTFYSPTGPDWGFRHSSYVTVNGQDTVHDHYISRAFRTLYPTNQASVSTNSPTFEWEDLAAAVEYVLQIYEGPGLPVFEDTGIVTNRHQTTAVLTDGVQYRWSVTAYDDQSPPSHLGTTVNDSYFIVIVP